MKPIKKSITYGRHQLTLETGEIARQAHGAVMVTMDDTVVLVTVVGARNVMPGQDFFPLTVDYQERFYAAGRIPGSFFKREGRPSEKETLTSRLIDRPIRPLFPEGFYNEVQVVATVLSSNEEIDPDIPAIIGASAALVLSGIPFDGPVGAARVGYIDNAYVLNPTTTELRETQLNLVVAGTQQAVLMVESEAYELTEEIMLGAVVYGHEQMQAVINAINELADEAGVTAWEWAPPEKMPHWMKKLPNWLKLIYVRHLKSSKNNRELKPSRQSSRKPSKHWVSVLKMDRNRTLSRKLFCIGIQNCAQSDS